MIATLFGLIWMLLDVLRLNWIIFYTTNTFHDIYILFVFVCKHRAANWAVGNQTFLVFVFKVLQFIRSSLRLPGSISVGCKLTKKNSKCEDLGSQLRWTRRRRSVHSHASKSHNHSSKFAAEIIHSKDDDDDHNHSCYAVLAMAQLVS